MDGWHITKSLNRLLAHKTIGDLMTFRELIGMIMSDKFSIAGIALRNISLSEKDIGSIRIEQYGDDYILVVAEKNEYLIPFHAIDYIRYRLEEE